jgi:hypothetical protein
MRGHIVDVKLFLIFFEWITILKTDIMHSKCPWWLVHLNSAIFAGKEIIFVYSRQGISPFSINQQKLPA